MNSNSCQSSKKCMWVGRGLSALVVLLMGMDGVMKLMKPEQVVKGTVELGYPESMLTCLGIVLLVSTILYAIPRTAGLGAILLTGYLGGAVATHVRVSHPLFTHTLLPVYFGIVIWLALILRFPTIKGALFCSKCEKPGT